MVYLSPRAPRAPPRGDKGTSLSIRRPAARRRRLAPARARGGCRRMFKREDRIRRIELRAELVDVAVTVVVQGDVRGEVQRRGRQLRWERPLGVAKVVVAIDQDSGVLIRNGVGERFHGDVREAEVD